MSSKCNADDREYHGSFGTHVTGGTVTVEAVFNYAGIGNLAVESAKYHDYNLLMIDVLITGFIVFLSSFVAQTVNEEIDPRMKDSEVRVW